MPMLITGVTNALSITMLMLNAVKKENNMQRNRRLVSFSLVFTVLPFSFVILIFINGVPLEPING
ncbi:hypothetical protein NUBL13782_23610 [Klebsiella pneumoniae]|nr:hypothetical protein NUBL13782_23610 [Klebsiella pneumoniae]